jgi:hypothetical protein
VLVVAGFVQWGRNASVAQTQNKRCDTVTKVTCPPEQICQIATHCFIGKDHRCVTVDTFPTCQPVPNDECTFHITGCRWEVFQSADGSCTGDSNVQTILCYGECDP